MSIDLSQLAAQLIKGNAEQVSLLTRQALDEGVSPQDVLQKGLLAGMAIVGQQFRDNVIFLPEVLVRARAMKAGMEHLEPLLAASGVEPVGRFVIGTVKGDIHDIGKNLVTMMLRGAGIQVIDLGINVTAQQFIDAVAEHKPDIIGMSALLTTTMVQMKVNMDAFQKAGVLDRTRVMVGGAPVTKEYAHSIGANGYAANASTAVTRALELIAESRAVRNAVQHA
ncbi:MAG TPA: corrinoid protein [Terriglobales bacterium]|nr:corrinoid protein [Terriglobales bacterium]